MTDFSRPLADVSRHRDFTPLTDADLDELDAALLALAEAGRGALPLDSVHGFFAGDLCGPGPRPLAEAVDFALGAAPAFASPRQAERVRALLRRLWMQVRAELEDEAFEPLLYAGDSDDDVPVFQGWCLGFLDAVESSEAWQDALDAEPDDAEEDPDSLAHALLPIVTLAYRAIHEALEDAAGDDTAPDDELPPDTREMVAALDDETLHELADSLGPAACLLHATCAGLRAAWAEPQQPVRVDKIGRNDPCPCGSGRKFKKCCGANAD
ncbi:uncharacterized protein EV699_103177 [Plasticicumulans lactativorans]|uniref:YecA family protein n=1 Tax=Plasticicumulans lactativorans TaxID=1133106 RepID=A0A4V2SDE7_9GAMM|nr:UPF0149 family protein [Plasticicumulans lactativorans]TCO83127.1 uncharacterized protein EV699_103177 [Plasticicumulans lactativorans]